MVKISFIVSIAAIFILDLHGNDGATMRRLEWDEARQKCIEVAIHSLEVGRVRTADLHAGILEQPGGQAAKIQFGADVGSGANDVLQSEIRGGLDEIDQVEHAIEVKL